MNFENIANTYWRNIQQTQGEVDATAELSLHTHLKTFLEQAATHLGYAAHITHEPRRMEIGRPDFVVKVQSGAVLGYIEAEAPDKNLDALTGHAQAQNARFIKNLDNFLLTNFVDFRLYTDGTLRATAEVRSANSIATLLDRFLGAQPMHIETPAVLAKHLARRTRELQTQIAATLKDEGSDVYRMFDAFKATLLTTLSPDDFADMYAQTLAYGLFAARCTLPNATHFSRLTAANALPRSNPFLRQLFHLVASPTLAENVTYVLDEIAVLLQNVSTAMLRTAFTTKTHSEDPVIHFYETFLAAYAPQRRVERGVYYTPPQVISYIVRSVDTLLKTQLKKRDGLADDDTLILDPATGTGGFLVAVLSHIREYVTETYGSGEWTRYVNAELVRRLFGFELLVAPYTIAHLKMSLFLQTQGWQADERLRIYLTNTLEEPVEKESYAFAGFISDEANAAVSVKKDAPILAILGNPPYQRESANPSRDSKGKLTFIGQLIEDYKQVDGKVIGGRDQKRPVQSDYVKFVRWGQWRIKQSGEGVMGYIVNNSFLDGQVFRGMRQSLMNSFNAIYLLNLHGNSRRKEEVPLGQADQNVFDIQQGVAILLCVKARENSAPAAVFYADLWGTREEKYRALSESDVHTTEWTELKPTSPHYLFVPQETAHLAEYERGWEISDIFPQSSTGIFTSRDKVTIHRTPEQVRDVVTDFLSLSETEVREKYGVKDSKNWTVRAAQADLGNHPDIDGHITPIRYRPFDTRYTYYTGQSNGFHTYPAPKMSPHLLAGKNVSLTVHRGVRSADWQHAMVTDGITEKSYLSNKSEPTAHVFPLYVYPEPLALCVCRVVRSPVWQHALVTDDITEKCYVSNRGSESSQIFPLYLNPHPEASALTTERYLNLNPDFLKAFSAALELPQADASGLPQGVAAEEIFAYIYAVLFRPSYRERYNEFLKYGFPRIPLPKNIAHFRKMAELGQALINWHLGRSDIPPRHRFEGEGEGIVSKIRYEDGNIWINQTQHFTDVPIDVWEFEVGAYQVCEKWLKDRRGETLSRAEVQHYRGILVAVAETLGIMSELDEGVL